MSLVAGESISDATALRAGEPEARWYAVQTRSRFEKIVRADLTACRVENYLPSATEIHQWKDRKKSVEETLFPGYVFVRFSERGPARLRVLRTNGVVRILGSVIRSNLFRTWRSTRFAGCFQAGRRARYIRI